MSDSQVDPPLERIIGNNVTRYRELRGMNQAELGLALEASLGTPWQRQSVWAAENGKRSFAAADLVGLALALGVTIGDLLATSKAVTVGKATMDPATVVALTSGGMDSSALYRIFLAAAEVKNSMRNQQILYEDLVRVLRQAVTENAELRAAIERDLSKAEAKFYPEARAVAERDEIDVSTPEKFDQYLIDWDWSTPQMKTARDVLRGMSDGEGK